MIKFMLSVSFLLMLLALICLATDFSVEALQARREWHDILIMLEENNFYPKIVYLVKISLKHVGEIRTFPDKQKLRDFINTRCILPEMLKGVLLSEREEH